jgi:two-component system LytT family response regulator
MTTPIRCLIVDDEPLAREAIRSCIALEPDLKIAGESGDGKTAIQLVESLRPDLVFLDIQMPEVGGFEVLHALLARSIDLPLTIFVTAHDTYALRAFEAHALDYLLKPIREERFKDAVARARSLIASGRTRETVSELTDLLADGRLQVRGPTRLPLRVEGRIVFVRLDQIEWIESEGNYVRLHASGREYAVRETLGAIEARLRGGQFMRIHRCSIVNVNCIQSLQPWFTGEYIVRLQSGKELTLTRTYRHNLYRLVGKEV